MLYDILKHIVKLNYKDKKVYRIFLYYMKLLSFIYNSY